MIALEICAWLATYLVHSSLLLGGAWLITRSIDLPRLRELIWKGALIGALITASLQPLVGNGVFSFGLDRLGNPWVDAVDSPSALGEEASLARDEVDAALLLPPGPSAANESGSLFGMLGATDSGSPIWSQIVLSLWLLAAGAGLISLWRQRARLQLALAHTSRISAGPMVQELRRQSRRLSMHVRLTSSPILTSPLALGSNEICVPTYMVDDMDPVEQSALLAHELEHLRRRDGAWLFFVHLLSKLLPIQPLIRTAGARLRQDAELLCDESALASTGDGVAIARCLATVAERFNGRALPTWTAAMASTDSELLQRVERVLGEAPTKPGAWRLTALSLSGIMTLGVLACTGPRVTSETAVPLDGYEISEQNTATSTPEDVVVIHIGTAWSSMEIEGSGKTEPVREFPIYEVEGSNSLSNDPEHLVSELIGEVSLGQPLVIIANSQVIHIEVTGLLDALLNAGFTDISFQGPYQPSTFTPEF